MTLTLTLTLTLALTLTLTPTPTPTPTPTQNLNLTLTRTLTLTLTLTRCAACPLPSLCYPLSTSSCTTPCPPRTTSTVGAAPTSIQGRAARGWTPKAMRRPLQPLSRNEHWSNGKAPRCSVFLTLRIKSGMAMMDHGHLK